MASKFLIDIEPPVDDKSGPTVRMVDDDQEETTGWIKLGKSFSKCNDEEAFAGAYLKSERVRRMTFEAQQIAYAVYLGEDHFDIHQVNPQWAQAIADRVSLAGKTPKSSAATRKNRM